MEYIDSKEMVVVFNKRMGLETVASKLALLNGEQIKKFFMERDTRFPKKMNAMALTSVLNERIKTLDSHSLTKDAFAKLESYSSFTEFQLQNLFEKIGTDEDFYLYRKNLWKILIRNHIGIGLQDGEVTRLINMKKYKVESFLDFTIKINEVTLDLSKEFDAYPKSKLESLLRDYFSLEEIRLFGKKYGFDIPARLKKDDLLVYVKDMMKAKRKLTLVLQRQLNDMTITQLNEFCTLQELGISSLMKKDELINLILFLIKQAKYPTIEAGTIIGSDMAEPLKFRVDLDAVDNFKRGIPKKVIYLEDEDNAAIDELDDFEDDEDEDEDDEEPKKMNPREALVAEIIQKLLPYLNIDAETAKTAISHGIDLPAPKSTKKSNAPLQKKKKQMK